MPDNVNDRGPFVLETVLEIKDDVDAFILHEIVNLPMQLMVEPLVFRDKALYEKHFQQMIDLGKTLVKTNDTLRGYKKAEKIALQEHKEKGDKDKNTNVLLGRHAPELDREIDSFLSGVKASLDSLAKILNPIFGLSLTGWHKGKREGQKAGESKLSGADVLNALERNVPKDMQTRIAPLFSVIERNLGWLTYLVWLRDSAHHHGGIKTISNIYYNSDTREIIPQYIAHTPDQNEKVSEFLTRTMNEFNGFVNNVICFAYIAKAPNGMVLQRKDNPVSYQWGIVQNP